MEMVCAPNVFVAPGLRQTVGTGGVEVQIYLAADGVAKAGWVISGL
jgi:hypothetical protein